MRFYLVILSIITYYGVFAQDLRVLDVNRDYEKYRISEHFDYVHPDFDTTKLTWVADMRVEFDTIIRGMIEECYKVLRDKSNRYGANAFSVNDFDIKSWGDNKYIDVSVYWIRMEDRDTNLVLQRAKKVYLFGFLGYHNEIEGYDVEINEKSFTMRSLSYREYEYEAGDIVEIHLGSSLRGTSHEIVIKEKMYPRFFNFHMVSGSFKNAWIGEYDLSFGLFLKQILRKDNSST